MAPAAPPLPPPMPLTFAEGQTLRRLVEQALDRARDNFIAQTVIRSTTTGAPLGGPDPRAVDAEVHLILARYLARRGLDLVHSDVFAKLGQLEAELAETADEAETSAIVQRLVAP